MNQAELQAFRERNPMIPKGMREKIAIRKFFELFTLPFKALESATAAAAKVAQDDVFYSNPARKG